MKPEKIYLCPQCDKNYGDCSHTNAYQILPKEETGRILSLAEFEVLREAEIF